MIGPLIPLEQILATPGDALGVTRSLERAPHLQSYSLAFHGRVIRHPSYIDFWRSLRTPKSRWQAVLFGEIALGERLTEAGIELTAYFDPTPEQEAEAMRRKLTAPTSPDPDGTRRGFNPMVYLWDCALTGELPYVKVGVLRDDPAGFGRHVMRDRLSTRYPGVFDHLAAFFDRTAERLHRLRDQTPWAERSPADRARPASREVPVHGG